MTVIVLIMFLGYFLLESTRGYEALLSIIECNHRVSMDQSYKMTCYSCHIYVCYSNLALFTSMREIMTDWCDTIPNQEVC